MSEEDAEKKKEFENQLNAFDGDWSTMQSSIRNSHKIEPVLIQCSLDQDEALTQATKKIEGDFCLQIIHKLSYGWLFTKYVLLQLFNTFLYVILRAAMKTDSVPN